MSTPLRIPVNCGCGYKAEVNELELGIDGKLLFWVECNRRDCWSGPTRERRFMAIEEWDRRMAHTSTEKDAKAC